MHFSFSLLVALLLNNTEGFVRPTVVKTGSVVGYKNLNSNRRADSSAGQSKVEEVFDELFPSGEGKQIFMGVLTRPVDAPPTPEEQQRRRSAAEASLTNIGDDERSRRRSAGLVFSALTAGLAVALPLLGVGLLPRALAEAAPVYLSLGFLASAEEGL